MGLTEKYIPHYTYADWERWEGLWELIDGCPIALIPSPPPVHQRVSGNIQTAFQSEIKSGCVKKCIVYPSIGYKISDYTIVAPDVLIVRDKVTKDLLDFPPALIVEVLTEASEKRDRELKFNYYEKEGVKYYLIADWMKESLEIYELVRGAYQLQDYENHFEFVLHQNCKIIPELNNIWE